MATDPKMLPVVNLARLARELAQDIIEPDQIRRAFDLTTDQFEKILEDNNFQRMLREMIRDWNSASGVGERVKLKAATAVEVALDTMFRDITDRTLPLNQRVEAVKLLAKLGELSDRGDIIGAAGVGSGVSININLGVPGDGQPPKVVNVTAEPKVIEHDEAEAG